MLVSSFFLKGCKCTHNNGFYNTLINKNIDKSKTVQNPYSALLLDWYDKNKRDLPWRTDNTPYHVWLSEIILQQTQVKQGLPYYLKITESFRTIENLANCEQERFNTYWQGLGYYSRARNLLKCAKTVVENYNGSFPNNYKELLGLPGIGPYTAAAIASICFGEAVIALDGNLTRVLSRVIAFKEDAFTNKAKKELIAFGEQIIDHQRPGDFNQALMDLGSNICTPKKPKCPECPFFQYCEAQKQNLVTQLPIKTRKQKQTAVTIDYFIIIRDNKIGLRKRTENIWNGLYEFPSNWVEKGEIKNPSNYIKTGNEILIESRKHLLTHKKMSINFYLGVGDCKDVVWVNKNELQRYSFPQVIMDFINDKIGELF